MGWLSDFTIDDFISGEKFQQICDIDLDWHTSEKNEKPFIIPEFLKKSEKPIKVFMQAHYLNQFMPIIESEKDCRFILVTQNSDGGIIKACPRWYDFVLKNIPDNVVKWFCQNCEIENEKLIPIPVATENKYCCARVHKQEKMLSKVINQKPFRDRKLALLQGNVWTNPRARVKSYELFRGKDWITIKTGINGAAYFDAYLENLCNHTFIFSPDGNGSDCVRTWEALYCGCIPIVQRHVFTEYFAQYLPILIIDKWEDVTESRLRWFVSGVSQNLQNYNFDMLKMSYWKEKINDYV